MPLHFFKNTVMAVIMHKNNANRRNGIHHMVMPINYKVTPDWEELLRQRKLYAA